MERLADLFYAAKDKNENKEAIWCDGESLTYGELAAMVSGYSEFLLKIGVQYGDHIAIALNSSVSYVAFMLAIADLGCVLVPINPTLPLDAVRTSFELVDVKHVIARSYFFEQMKGAGLNVSGLKICMDTDYPGTVTCPAKEDFKAAKRPEFSRVKGDELYIITMTSGSTGSPKPIGLTQKNKQDRAMTHIRMYGITKNDRVLAATPLYHSLAERLVLIPLMIGATSILLARYTPQIFLKCLKEQNVTFSIAVSAQLKQVAGLLQSGDYGIESMRCLVSSSALLDMDTKNMLLRELKCDFHEMYGTSETSTITDIDIKNCVDKKNSVGKPIDGANVRILGSDGKEKEEGSVGEIVCKTNLLCNGYYGRPDVFSDAVLDGYFKTGDLGYLDEDGFLYFTGRKKELIITGGINVYPSDVENCINRLEGVEECVAFPMPDGRLGEAVAVAILTKDGVTINKRSVQLWCAKNLADFQQPHEFFFVDALPRNDMGKLVRTGMAEYVKKHGGR